jgi:hypothetical protein
MAGINNPYTYDSAAWWRHEARLSAEDEHPQAAVAAMSLALDREGIADKDEVLWRYAVAVGGCT